MEPAPRRLSLIGLVPNMLTVGALCAGLTAIRFAIEGHFRLALLLIVLAAIMDGLDGRIARLLRSESQIGAELDSLCDFVNFGVAPGLILWIWALQDMRAAGYGVGPLAVMLLDREPPEPPPGVAREVDEEQPDVLARPGGDDGVGRLLAERHQQLRAAERATVGRGRRGVLGLAVVRHQPAFNPASAVAQRSHTSGGSAASRS